MRMQGAETSKTMLPYWRRVHLHKSASFKTIFYQNDAKIDPEMPDKFI